MLNHDLRNPGLDLIAEVCQEDQSLILEETIPVLVSVSGDFLVLEAKREAILKEVDPKFYINYHDDVVYMEEVTETLNEQTNPINTDLFNRFLKDFWPQYRNQLYKGLYNYWLYKGILVI